MSVGLLAGAVVVVCCRLSDRGMNDLCASTNFLDPRLRSTSHTRDTQEGRTDHKEPQQAEETGGNLA